VGVTPLRLGVVCPPVRCLGCLWWVVGWLDTGGVAGGRFSGAWVRGPGKRRKAGCRGLAVEASGRSIRTVQIDSFAWSTVRTDLALSAGMEADMDGTGSSSPGPQGTRGRGWWERVV
jgi:hypothetical protein